MGTVLSLRKCAGLPRGIVCSGVGGAPGLWGTRSAGSVSQSLHVWIFEGLSPSLAQPRPPDGPGDPQSRPPRAVRSFVPPRRESVGVRPGRGPVFRNPYPESSGAVLAARSGTRLRVPRRDQGGRRTIGGTLRPVRVPIHRPRPDKSYRRIAKTRAFVPCDIRVIYPSLKSVPTYCIVETK